jgi:hypothetical protein
MRESEQAVDRRGQLAATSEAIPTTNSIWGAGPQPNRSRPPAQNRVQPDGRIEALATRGAWMGNRGQLHDGSGTRTIRRSHHGKSWSICALEHKDRRVAQWQPGAYTPLFFVDEAIALAAGHRPCAECRRASYNDFRFKWAWTHPYRAPYATAIDEQLHAERLPEATGQRPLHELPWAFVPTGAIVMLEGMQPAVVLDSTVAPYDQPNGAYAKPLVRPRSGFAYALTPPSTLAILQRGYPVQIDPSATVQA